MQIPSSKVFGGFAMSAPGTYASTSSRVNDAQNQSSKADSPALRDSVASGASTATRTTSDTAREKIRADAAEAVTKGERIVYDTVNGGRFPDFSTLSESELGAVAKGVGFSKDEALVAKAELSTRLDKLLSSFGDDPRAISMAVKTIYPALDASVRDALGWDENMLKSADAVIRNFGSPASSSEMQSLLGRIMKAQTTPGTLKIDFSMTERRGATINLVA